MSAKNIGMKFLIALGLELIGFCLILVKLNIWVALGVLLIVWGSNVSHAIAHDIEKSL